MTKRRLALSTLASALILLGGCNREDPMQPTADNATIESEVLANRGAGAATYRVTIKNLMKGQPISPPVAATHRQSLHMFRNGHFASSEIEAIAEDGNQAPMVALLSGMSQVTNVVDVGMPLTRRGTVVGDFTDEVTFDIQARAHDRLSIAMMLICTNDGFTGLNGVTLPYRGRRTYYARAYDAGTENNTEMSADIVDACSALGPIALAGDPNGNEDDAVATMPPRRIRPHRGIRGTGDLDPSNHGWYGATARITIQRVGSAHHGHGDDDD